MLTECFSVWQEGKPKIYISHGTNDEVLSVDYCSRRLVPRLQKQGYDVKYHVCWTSHCAKEYLSGRHALVSWAAIGGLSVHISALSLPR